MWTPKRILILIAGTMLFLFAFVLYDLFLGGYDGLPPLPPDYVNNPEWERDKWSPDPTDDEKKMAMAWGRESDEARRPFILNIGSKGMLLSVDKFEIEPDGKVKLSPFSVALFPKKKGDTSYPEINTIQCDFAYLTLDRPVSNFTELTSRRVIAIELRGSSGVTIVNNRRTPEKNDDIEVTIKSAPVYYEERTNKIWSEGFVKLLDTSSQPNPTEITAKGLEVHLTKDSQPLRPAKSGPTPKKGEGVTGVELLILKSHVEMHLYMDAKSGFLTGGQEIAGKPAPKTPTPSAPAANAATEADKSHIMVKTAGKMEYDLIKELAQFDSPGPPPGAAPGEADQVLLTREHKITDKERKFDQLVCDSLQLAFRKKDPTAIQGSKDSFGGDKEIDTALASAKPGQEVTLTMDADNLAAWGAQLYYRSPTATSGAQTILRGSPMHAIRDGNTIEAQELHMIGPDKNGKGQQTFAKGPGRIDLLDKALSFFGNDDEATAKQEKKKDAAKESKENDEKVRYPLHAFWTDSLISIKDHDGDKVYDLLTLTGDAKFLDEEHKQSLMGQRIQVWLEPTTGPDGNKSQAGGGSSRQEPHRVEAYEKVSVQSPEMIIERTEHMTIVFKRVPASDDLLPQKLPEPTKPAAKDANAAGSPGLGKPLDPMAPPAESKTPLVQLQAPQPETKTPAKTGNSMFGLSTGGDKDKPRKPIRLWAHEVVAYVSTEGTKKQLQELVTEGDVHVQQEGETSKDKGLDISGEMLNLIYNQLGNRLLVYGDTRRAAQLQMGELTIIGPKVDIDQKENTANVDGTGAMKMPSNTTFDGNQPAKTGTYVTIHWNKDMIFNGKFAEFHGGVQAFQDTAVLKCQTLQATLDKYVSFKEGQKENQNAKIDKLVCDRKVFVEDEARSPEGKRLSYRRLIGIELDMDNPEGRANVAGPGTVIQIAQGSSDLGPGGPMQVAIKPPPPTQPGELKFTRIDFEGRMYGVNKPGVRSAKFFDNVEVYHQPGDDPNIKVNPNQPPKDGFYMRCAILDVQTKEVDGQSYQFMVAQRNAFFRSPEYFGNADTIKFDQSEETIIFEGNPTTLFKLGATGEKPKRIEGKRILYNRKTGNMKADGVNVISSWLSPEERDGNRSLVARLDLDRQNEALLRLGLVARDDRQKLAADRAVGDLALVRRRDGEADAVMLVGAVLDHDLGGLFVHELERALLLRR